MKRFIKILLSIFAIFFLVILVSFFILADLRTDEIKNGIQSEADKALAKNLLEEANRKQGLDKINAFKTYEVIGSDYWKGFMGEQGLPWAWNKDKMAMRFSVGDFDGQVEALEGDKKGYISGIQSWDYYKKVDGKFDPNVKDNAGEIFTLAAFHYFFEFAPRLLAAPFIRYAGKDQLDGQEIEKVFVSWGNEKTKEYDQYILWIGKESGLIEASSFTVRDSAQPAPGFVYGCIRFDDFREVQGVLIPFTQTAQLFDPKGTTEDYMHQLTIESFEWDAFPVSDIRPFANVKAIGDDKPTK